MKTRIDEITCCERTLTYLGGARGSCAHADGAQQAQRLEQVQDLRYLVGQVEDAASDGALAAEAVLRALLESIHCTQQFK